MREAYDSNRNLIIAIDVIYYKHYNDKKEADKEYYCCSNEHRHRDDAKCCYVNSTKKEPHFRHYPGVRCKYNDIYEREYNNIYHQAWRKHIKDEYRYRHWYNDNIADIIINNRTILIRNSLQQHKMIKEYGKYYKNNKTIWILNGCGIRENKMTVYKGISIYCDFKNKVDINKFNKNDLIFIDNGGQCLYHINQNKYDYRGYYIKPWHIRVFIEYFMKTKEEYICSKDIIKERKNITDNKHKDIEDWLNLLTERKLVLLQCIQKFKKQLEEKKRKQREKQQEEERKREKERERREAEQRQKYIERVERKQREEQQEEERKREAEQRQKYIEQVKREQDKEKLKEANQIIIHYNSISNGDKEPKYIQGYYTQTYNYDYYEHDLIKSINYELYYIISIDKNNKLSILYNRNNIYNDSEPHYIIKYEYMKIDISRLKIYVSKK